MKARALGVAVWLASGSVLAQQPTAAEAEQPEATAESGAEAQAQLIEVPAYLQGPQVLRNLVVPQFDAPPHSGARAAVLRTLAEHTEVDVVSIDDVTFAAQRLQADPNTAAGREKLSRELGLDAWLDGKVTETSAHLTLATGDGNVLREVEVEVDDARSLDTSTGQELWASLGPTLSPLEAYRRAVLAEYERARLKLSARQAAWQHQVELAHQARAHRAFVLRAQYSLAQRKQAALQTELDRQSELGKAELLRQAEQARQAKLARQAEAARKLELARQATEARKAEAARRREQAKAAAAAKVAAKADAKAAKAARQKAKSERAAAKRKRKHSEGTGLTNMGAQRAHARAEARKKKGQAKPAREGASEQSASDKRKSAANGG